MKREELEFPETAFVKTVDGGIARFKPASATLLLSTIGSTQGVELHYERHNVSGNVPWWEVVKTSGGRYVHISWCRQHKQREVECVDAEELDEDDVVKLLYAHKDALTDAGWNELNRLTPTI